MTYFLHSCVLILVPQSAGMVFMVVALPILIGEVMFCLWLLFRETGRESLESDGQSGDASLSRGPACGVFAGDYTTAFGWSGDLVRV